MPINFLELKTMKNILKISIILAFSIILVSGKY